jgi:large subunit ribosomal protein L23
MTTNWEKIMESKLSPVTTVMDLIKYPVITEKSYLALSKNANKQYTFDVDLRLTKPQIKKLFESLYNVNVIALNTHIPPRKMKRLGTSQGNQARYKRVILTLKEGQSLNYNLTATTPQE